MPPRIPFLSAPRALSVRSRPIAPANQCLLLARRQTQCRNYSDPKKDLPKADGLKGPNTETLPSISEEAASMASTAGTEGPDLEQGTPVEEVVQNDKEAIDKLPQVMKDDVKNKNGTRSYSTFASSGRQYSTSAIQRQEITKQPGTLAQNDIIAMTRQQEAEEARLIEEYSLDRELANMAEPEAVVEDLSGLKFGMPKMPLPPGSHYKDRYDPLVDQLVGLMIQDGKKSIAQQNVAIILNHLRTAPPPTYSPIRPMLPGAPPPSHLPLNPVLYLTVAIDSVAPLLRIKAIRGAAGGGMALQLPSPLGLRQRRRTAITWILDQASKRQNRGSGKGTFAHRVADELIAVVEGKSSVWERRGAIHKLAVSARANILDVRKRR
ncbi:ribosomal protein S7 [Aulographum hederae CBS 113979]|uniref:Small ribosomal subunit protein uS7m n=1 Tax=Aulographum hederae CBS 113979 TaxID=1176131 RepID=A0A6G1HG31_9PEZI|nr:ribosomal protein S7 [Aulographum hederae CBS 113979]